MRKYFYCLFVFFTCGFSLAGFGQQWFKYSPTAGFDINTLAVMKNGHIAIGGGKESLDSIQIMFLTKDYGATWNENAHDGLASWNKSIAFADSANGVGVGYQGRIIRTNDGGANWGNAVSPIQRNLNKVTHITAQTYFAVGGIDSINKIHTILKTIDGGVNWSIKRDTIGSCLRSILFTSPTKGIAVGDSGLILISTNSGNSWTYVASPIQRDFNSITFINSSTGFIVGGSGALGSKTILKTIDGGLSWVVLTDVAGGVLNDVAFADSTTGYIVGDSSTILKTDNGGQTWVAQQIDQNLTGSESFRSVQFLDKNVGAVAGQGGLLYVYIGWPLDLFTVGANVKDSTSADLYASINTHGYPSLFSFTYSTDSTFSSATSLPVQSLITDSFFPAYTHLTGLTPNTWYYYYVSSGVKSGDTLRFYTGEIYPLFATQNAVVSDTGTIQFKGAIRGYSSISNLKFEYGTSPFLGDEMNATPSAIGDTSFHSVSAIFSTPLPFTLYYYRLKGLSLGDTVIGDVYFAGNIYRFLETQNATYITDTTAVLNGLQQGGRGSVNLSFEYQNSTGQFFNTASIPYQHGDSLNFISLPLNGLISGQLYSYRIKCESSIGVRYGKWLSFFTGKSKDSVIQTLPAQLITSNSATLEGMVNHFKEPVTLSFEYGTDSAMSNSVFAMPTSVSDSLYHKVSYLLTNVPNNTRYFYRIKAVNTTGSAIYGDTKVVFVGDNDIPNWDFQYWNTQTFSLPAGWNFGTKNFSRVPGHSGKYALNVSNVNIAIMGFPLDKRQGGGLELLGGVPFSARPDSLTFFIKGSLASGDSSVVILNLRKGSVVVAKSMMLIKVNSPSAFQRISIPIQYQSSLTPDSLVLGITTVNPSYPTPGNQLNNITVDDFVFVPSTQPIYNGNLETWFDVDLITPESWYSPVFFGLDSVNKNSTTTMVSRVQPRPDEYAAEIKNKRFTDLGLLHGDMGLKNYALYGDEAPSFAVKNRYQTLNGVFEAFPDKGDTLSIEIMLYKNGNKVGYGVFKVKDTVAQFTQFEIPIFYNYPDSLMPDSADIEIHAHTLNIDRPKGLSRFVVDKLHFDGFVSSIDDEAISAKFDENGIKVYPNPTSNNINLELSETFSDESSITVHGLNGQILKELKMLPGETKATINMSEFDSGVYFLKWTNGRLTANRKFIICK